jgi:hypothetical protein
MCGLAHVGSFCYGVVKEHVYSFVEWLSCGYHCAWVCHCGVEVGHPWVLDVGLRRGPRV